MFENQVVVYRAESESAFPFITLPASSLSMERGKMIAKKVYKADDEQPLMEEFFQYTKPVNWNLSFTYSTFMKEQTFGFEAIAFFGFCSGGFKFETTYFTVSHYKSYYYPLYLSKKTTKNYFEGSPLITEEHINYSYDGEFNNVYVTEKITTDSKGNEIKKKFKYPIFYQSDLGYMNSIPSKMVNKNILNTPIETLKFVDGKIVSGTFTYYDAFPFVQNLDDLSDSHQILPKKIYNLETSAPIADADFTKSTLSSGGTIIQKDSRYEPTYNFDAYNLKGAPLQSHKENDVDVSYLWGYHQTQPIAKIENISYETLEQLIHSLPSDFNSVEKIQALSNADIDYCLDSESCSETSFRNALDALRSVLPKNAMMTTYTYDPLTGVTSITDPRGETIYYEYDEFSRLKHVKDADGNILSKNEYHYKN